MVFVVIYIVLGMFSIGEAGHKPTACYNGWVPFEGSCYLFADHLATFTESEHYCEQQGGRLVEVYNALENAFLKDEMKRLKPVIAWIGATDEYTEGAWRWYSSDDALNYTDWVPNQHVSDGEDCAVFWNTVNYQWADANKGEAGHRPTACYNGWVAFEGSCYLFAEHLATFTEAEHYCVQQGGRLVEVYSALENAFLKDELKRLKPALAWIGATDEYTEGAWRWYSSDDALNYTDWASYWVPHQHVSDGEDCAVFWNSANYNWSDADCTRTGMPVCKQRGVACPSCNTAVVG